LTSTQFSKSSATDDASSTQTELQKKKTPIDRSKSSGGVPSNFKVEIETTNFSVKLIHNLLRNISDSKLE